MQMNQVQQDAMVFKDGPMMVLAGPGSGKTLVITQRTKHLIVEHKIAEDNILVITFTKAAAGEMKTRFLASMGKERTRVSFGTFHAVFFMMLKHAYHLGSANVIAEDERVYLVKEMIHRMKLEYEDEKEFVSDLLGEISMVKGNRIELNNYYSTSCGDEIFRTIYQEYNTRLRNSNRIDYDDMLVLCYELLSQREDILRVWQNKYQYILVDEFQDINKVQYDIVKMLAAPRNNLFIVGDDDQSIYRFRGAKPEIMLNFPNDYPECKTLLLNHNYRSSSNIILAANRVITRNEKRFAKEISSVRGKGEPIKLREFPTMRDQNRKVADQIRRLHQEGMLFSNIAILLRTNMGAGDLIQKLMEYNIPFQMRDNLPNLFDHWITGDILTYIQLATGNLDRNLFLKIMNRPKRYISRDAVDQPTVSFEDLKDYYEDKSWMLDRIDQMEYDLAMVAGMAPYAAINYIRKAIGYEEYLKEYAEARRIKVDELTEVLDELLDSARNYRSYEQWFSYMTEYKEELKRQMDATKASQEDSVTISTMHSSKGLEFKAVFIVDANEEITPHKKAVLPADIEEERRLFYVAMTRAKDSLYIYYSKERYNKKMSRSRFVDEITEADSSNKPAK